MQAEIIFFLQELKMGSKDEATEPQTEKLEKNPAAVSLGRLGGLKGGKARAASLTPAERSAIAKKAAQSRWKKD